MRSPAPKQKVPTVRPYFNQHLIRSLKRAVADLFNSYFRIQKIERIMVQMFLYKMYIVYRFQAQDYG